LPSTVVSASAPTDEHVCADRKRHTDPRSAIGRHRIPTPSRPHSIQPVRD
jgi:hypothetical protein